MRKKIYLILCLLVSAIVLSLIITMTTILYFLKMDSNFSRKIKEIKLGEQSHSVEVLFERLPNYRFEFEGYQILIFCPPSRECPLESKTQTITNPQQIKWIYDSIEILISPEDKLIATAGAGENYIRTSDGSRKETSFSELSTEEFLELTVK